MTTFSEEVTKITDSTRDMLIAKNKSYGDSALDPIRIFSKADSLENLKVRIDDKLSRISRGTGFAGDNDIDDLIGYLILYKIGVAREKPYEL